MSTNFSIEAINYVIYNISSCEQNIVEFEKKPPKYKWEYCDVIILLLLLGVKHCLALLHMSKNLFYINSTGKHMDNFSIGYRLILH